MLINHRRAQVRPKLLALQRGRFDKCSCQKMCKNMAHTEPVEWSPKGCDIWWKVLNKLVSSQTFDHQATRHDHLYPIKSGASPSKMHKKTPGLKHINILSLIYLLLITIEPLLIAKEPSAGSVASMVVFAEASLIIGDSAIEIQEVGSSSDPSGEPQSEQANQVQQQHQQEQVQPIVTSTTTTAFDANRIDDQSSSSPGSHQLILGSTSGINEVTNAIEGHTTETSNPFQIQNDRELASLRQPSGPLPPILKSSEDDITDGDKNSRRTHDYDLSELQQTTNPGNSNGLQGTSEKDALNKVLSAASSGNGGQDLANDHEDGKRIAGKVVDFELTPAGGHNKAKIKKKKKHKKMNKKLEASSEEAAKKWAKKKEEKKKAEEKKVSHHLKKKKEEANKAKKKWGHQEHGQKKKGKFKKKKWGKKVKKGQGIKKGKRGRKFLKDKGHKNTGFKTVYHKEEWGNSNKWHDIKREKKWDEKAKKWKNKWNKEKGKKYKGEHMKKFENKKKEGNKYKKAKKEKSKKVKVEKYESGKKKHLEEHKKKKENGMKKEEKELKKKMKKKKKKP